MSKKQAIASVLNLTDREEVIFNLLLDRSRKKNGSVSTDEIIRALKENKSTRLKAKKTGNSLGVLMKYLTAKACQYGYLITMVEGGRGAGNVAHYGLRRFDIRKAA